MELQWKTELHAAAVLTFEDMCLLMPDSVANGKLESKTVWTAHVGFTGPQRGKICVAVDSNFLPELVRHIVGEEDLEDHEMLLDGLGEVGNIIAGNILPKISGEEAVYVLDAPEISQDQRVSDNISELHQILVTFEEGEVAVWVEVES